MTSISKHVCTRQPQRLLRFILASWTRPLKRSNTDPSSDEARCHCSYLRIFRIIIITGMQEAHGTPGARNGMSVASKETPFSLVGSIPFQCEKICSENLAAFLAPIRKFSENCYVKVFLGSLNWVPICGHGKYGK